MKPQTKTKPAAKTTNESPEPPKTKAQSEEQNQIGFPNVGRKTVNKPTPPVTLQVCGNTIPVRNGKAGEGDPKVIRRRKQENLRRRGAKEGKEYSEEITRI